jgi:signal transduction histidine kinase
MTLSPTREPTSQPRSSHTVACLCGSAATSASHKSRNRHSRADDAVLALAEMTGGITHDFRNILAVINAGASVAERHVDEPERVRLCLEGIHEAVQRGLKLTSRLLEFTRESGHAAQPQDLNQLLRELHAFLQYGAGHAVRVAFELAPSLPRCIVDPVQFNAAVLNLVVNARDAMPGGGEIKISTTAVSGPVRDTRSLRAFVHVSVEDSGEGMSPTVLRKVFKRHFTTKGDAGTGLGVPQVCAFMAAAGGHINVSSAVGVGTTFKLVFPAEAPPPPAGNSDWRQVDRWINEGGADEEGTSAAPIAGAQDANPSEADREPANAERHRGRTHAATTSHLPQDLPLACSGEI